MVVGKNFEEVIYNKQQWQFVRAVREGSKAKLIHFKDAQLLFSSDNTNKSTGDWVWVWNELRQILVPAKQVTTIWFTPV